jgi:hypothetical protein
MPATRWKCTSANFQHGTCQQGILSNEPFVERDAKLPYKEFRNERPSPPAITKGKHPQPSERVATYDVQNNVQLCAEHRHRFSNKHSFNGSNALRRGLSVLVRLIRIPKFPRKGDAFFLRLGRRSFCVAFSVYSHSVLVSYGSLQIYALATHWADRIALTKQHNVGIMWLPSGHVCPISHTSTIIIRARKTRNKAELSSQRCAQDAWFRSEINSGRVSFTESTANLFVGSNGQPQSEQYQSLSTFWTRKRFILST